VSTLNKIPPLDQRKSEKAKELISREIGDNVKLLEYWRVGISFTGRMEWWMTG